MTATRGVSLQEVLERCYKLIDKTAVVVSALAPLALFVAIRAFDRRDGFFWACVVVFCLGVVSVVYFIVRARGANGFAPSITRVEDVGGEATAYLASFVFPFLATSKPSFLDSISYAVFAIIYLIVLVNTNLLAVNPLLYVFGFRVWRVESPNIALGSALVIGRSRPIVSEAYSMSGHNNIYVQTRNL
jgi:hypothetical protein